VAAPEASRIVVKLAASIAPAPSADRQRIEFAAKARRASPVLAAVLRERMGPGSIVIRGPISNPA
jgi:hypothetical protein